MVQTELERLFAHMFWADRKVLELLRSSPVAGGNADALRLYAHLLAAERVWLLRLNGEDSSVQPIWPEPALATMEETSAANEAGYTSLLRNLTPSHAEWEVDYRSSAGESFRTSSTDILLHVALHGSYHRGQVARAVRQAGGTPVNTDYIMYVREQS